MTIRDLPRWARALLDLALPADWRDDIQRDLEEAWSVRRTHRGRLGSHLWLWGQCVLFSLRFVPERIRESGPQVGVGSTDLKLALRSIARTPLVGLLAVVSLSVGIGAALTGYTFIEGGLLTDLPFDGGDRIVLVEDYDQTARTSVGVLPPEYLRRRQRLESFERLEAFQQRSVVIQGDTDTPQVVTALFTTPGFLHLTGVAPMQGRLPDDEDVAPGSAPVAILPHSLWVRAMGADPDAVGSRMHIAGVERTVIGIMPEGFGFPWADDLWLPFDVRDAEGPVRMIGKLRPGIGLSSARAEMSVVAEPDPTQIGPEARVEHLVTGVTRPLVNEGEIIVLAIPIAVLVLLLLVMATNVANLILARNAARAPELAVRSALGASRFRVVGQLVTEVAVLTGVATLAGVALSQAGLDLATAHLRFPFWVDFSLDAGAVAFAVALGAMVTTVSGLVPALRATRGTRGSPLAMGAGASSVRFGRLAGALIVVQVTVCVGFLSTATLLGQSLLGYTYDRYGLPAQETLVAQLYFGFPDELNDPDAGIDPTLRSGLVADFMTESTRKREVLREAMEALPGIRVSAFASRFPGNESERSPAEIEGTPEPPRTVEVARVGPGYFDVVDADIVQGRLFEAADFGIEGTPPTAVVLVNAPFAEERLRGANPIGRRLRLYEGAAVEAGTDADIGEWKTIVGVVPDLGLNPGNPEDAAGVYLPLGDTNIIRMALRGDGDPGAWTPRLVEEARRIDPEIQVQWSRTLADQMAEPVMIFRGLGTGFLVLGLLALLLSSASIHALTACTVTRRTRELGIRQALGADGRTVVRLVLARAGGQLALGMVLGTAVAFGLLRLATVMPWEVRHGNPAALLLVLAALSFSGLAALARPLSRALAIRPADAMRVE